MPLSKLMAVWLAFLLIIPAARGVDSPPAEQLARLKVDAEEAWKILDRRESAATEAEKAAITDCYCEAAGVLARRALALAEGHPDAPEAAQAVVWVIDGGLGSYSARLNTECDAAYDLLARRYLDGDAILPVIRTAWSDAAITPHAGAFLQAALDRSTNPRVRALACFSLGRHHYQFVRMNNTLDDPARSPAVAKYIGPENVRRVRALPGAVARVQAEAYYERTLREFTAAQPMGRGFPPLGEQAEGDLYKMRNLEVGRILPDLEGVDVDGRPMKLADFRGKVVVVSFWATWCGPCMGMVPAEKALVERMKGRPFALVGVNGDDDLDKARSVFLKEGITWRSFRDGGPHGPISTRWGVSAWPTTYVIDPQGIIRKENVRGEALDRAVEQLVAEAEALEKPGR